MRRVKLLVFSLLLAAGLYGAYNYIYLPLELRKIRAEEDYLASRGFSALLYDGDEVEFPGIVLRIPFNWRPDIAVFRARKYSRSVVVIVARGDWMSDEILGLMSSMPRLQEIWLDNQSVDDNSMRHFVGNTRVKVLGLYNTKITGKTLKLPGFAPKLEELDLRETAVDENDIEYLCALNNLHSLRLWGIPVQDVHIEKPTCLSRMRDLHLGLTEVTREVVSSLLKFPNLERVELSHRLQEADLLRLLALKSIRKVDAGICNIIESTLKLIEARSIDLGHPPMCE